jgi:signal transduction histidine kinase
MQVENWLRENESLVLPDWMRKVRSKGGIGSSGMSTQELRHHVFLIYYDRLCKALTDGKDDDLDQMLHRLVADHIRQYYDISQILQFPLQFKSVVWHFLLQDFPAPEAQAMMEQIEPTLDHSTSVLVEAHAELTRAKLNEKLDEFNFLTERLAVASEETERAFQQLRSLYAISRTLNSTLDIQHTLEAIADNLVALPSIDCCVIWHVTSPNTLQVGAVKGQAVTHLADATLPLDPPTSFVGRALSTQRRQQFEAENDALAPLLVRPDAVAFPMFNENRPIGVIMINNHTRDRPLDSSIISLVQAASEQAAVALENAQLYAQVTRFNQQLEEKVRQRTKELEESYAELERVNRDLERLDRTKSDFISIAAHELKTPLTLIQGYTNILRENSTIKNTPLLTKLMLGILQGSRRLQDIIENMIDVSAIDTQVLQLCLSTTSVRNILRTLIRQYSSVLQERHLTLTAGDLSELPYIEADAKRLYQAFENVFLNAIKYTPDGGKIGVDSWVLDSSAGEQWIEVVVSDSGIGIDPEDQERIFDKFYQTGELSLHSSGKTKFKGGGPGLGLAIAKGIIQAHGGKIWAKSEGHNEETCPGSQFHVILPVRNRAKISPIVSSFSYERAPESSSSV